MLRRRSFLLLTGLILTTSLVSAAEDATLRAVLDKAIVAQGGKEALTKFRASTIKFKGTAQADGAAVPISGEVLSQGADQQRVVIQGEGFRLVQVIDRDKGWVQFNGDTFDMQADKLAEAKEEAHASFLATLVPLLDKAYTLSSFGDATVGGRKAIGINVAHQGNRDVTLFFDAENHRMVKSIAQVKDDAGRQFSEETLFDDFRDVNGTLQPNKFTVTRNGKPHFDGEVVELQVHEKLDDSTFAKP